MTAPLEVGGLRRRGSGRADRVFNTLLALAAGTVLATILAIAAFLLAKAWPSLSEAGLGFFTEKGWLPDAADPKFGIAALTFGTVVSSIVALVIAVPIALGTALFLTEVVRGRVSKWIGYMVELLAAVPSVVYGLWGLVYLVPKLKPVQEGLDRTLGFIPIFHSRTGTYGRSLFAAAVVLAIMVVPIVAAIARELFRQVPIRHREAALALGATRWETIRFVVLPASVGGMVGAVMLGFGRALGETIAVALVLASAFTINPHILEPGGNTIAANIATKFGEAGATGRSALIASGLVLFVITLVVNVVARRVVGRNAAMAEAR